MPIDATRSFVVSHLRAPAQRPEVVAKVQAAPVFMNLEASVDKATSYLKEAAENGASLVAFPETCSTAIATWVISVSGEARYGWTSPNENSGSYAR